jgi:hypothetical protein
VIAAALDLPLVDPHASVRLHGAGQIGPNVSDKANVAAPLWPGASFTEEDRHRAIYRGLRFIYSTAHNSQDFSRHGHDYLWCFETAAKAFKDAAARRMALSLGRGLARRWRRRQRSIPAGTQADTLTLFTFASRAADELGVRDDLIKEKIRRAAARFSASDFLDFDPATEPPPGDVPLPCARCDSDNLRGSRVCSICKATLKIKSRYEVWLDALVTTWAGDHYGVKLGSSYADVIKWLPAMRPYRGRENGTNPEFYDTVYAVTHVIYTLNDYSLYKLSPAWLPQEFEFLKASLKESIEMKDPDMLGEFMDSLRAFGLTEDDPLIRTGMDYLLSHQNSDGSWSHKRLRYHPTWTAIDGLSDYCWQGERLSFPELKPLLEKWAKTPAM